MRKTVLSLIFLSCIQSFSFGQEIETKKSSIYLRGKVAAFFVVEDAFFRNASIGAEFRLFQRHSFGLDFVYFRWRYEQDSLVNGMDSGSGPSSYARRDYLLADYRFYPFKNLMKTKSKETYINVFTKIGKVKSWSEEGANFSYADKQVDTQKMHFNDFGLAAGLKIDFGKKDRFGLDVNFGAVYRRENVYQETGYDLSGNYFVSNLHEESWKVRPHMRLNLYFRLLSF